MAPERAPAQPPPSEELGRALRRQLERSEPGLRFVAQGLLGAGSRIDGLGIDAAGRALLLLIGPAGEDLALVARGLAQRAWVEARLPDWQQLAPGLGLRSDQRPRLALLCPAFGEEARAAAAALGSEAPLLLSFRCLRDGQGQLELLLDAAPEELPDREVAPAHSGARAAFRSGLSDEDLGLSPEERSDFER